MVHPHMLNLKYMKMYTSSTPLRLPCTQNRIIIFRTHGSVEKDGWWWVSFFETLSNKLGMDSVVVFLFLVVVFLFLRCRWRRRPNLCCRDEGSQRRVSSCNLAGQSYGRWVLILGQPFCCVFKIHQNTY